MADFDDTDMNYAAKFAMLFDEIDVESRGHLELAQLDEALKRIAKNGFYEKVFEPRLSGVKSGALSRTDFVALFVPPATPALQTAATPTTPMSLEPPSPPTGSATIGTAAKKLSFDANEPPSASEQQLRGEVERLREQLIATIDELQHFKNQHAAAELSVREQYEELVRKEQRCGELDEKVKVLTRAVEAARAEVVELKAALLAADEARGDEQRKHELAAKKAEVRHQAAVLELSQVRKTSAQFEASLNAQCDKTAAAEARASALGRDKFELESTLETLQTHCAELERAVDDLKQNNKDLSEELELQLERGTLLRSDSTPRSAMPTPAATPAKAGLFRTPSTPNGPIVMLRPTMLDEIVAATSVIVTPPAAPAVDVELLKLYERSVRRAEHFSERIAALAEKRDEELQRLNDRLAQQQAAAARVRLASSPVTTTTTTTTTTVVVQKPAYSTARWLYVCVAVMAVYFGMCANALASATPPGYRDSWPS